jgi:hypothetical protein
MFKVRIENLPRNVRKLVIRATWRNFRMKTLFLFFYFIYLYIIIFNLGLFWLIIHCFGVYFIIVLILVDYYFRLIRVS